MGWERAEDAPPPTTNRDAAGERNIPKPTMGQSKSLEKLPATQERVLLSQAPLLVSPGMCPPTPALGSIPGILKMPLGRPRRRATKKGKGRREASGGWIRPFQEPQQQGRARSIPDTPLGTDG